jgi:hypothetical protein
MNSTQDLYYNAKYNLPAALGELYLQFAYFMDSAPYTNSQLMVWRHGTVVMGGLKINYTYNTIEVYFGNFVTKLGEFPFTVNAWQVIELHLKVDDSDNNIIAVRKDMGPLAVNATDFGGDGYDSTIDNFIWGATSGGNTYIDDIILNDTAGSRNNSWPNGLRIIKLGPTGDGGTLQFTPTPSGGHYSTVDEVPPVGTDNLKAATSGLVDELALADCPADVLTVAAVIPTAFAFKASGNAPTRVALGLKISGTNYYSADLDLSVSQSVAKNLMEVSPATGSPFTSAVLNAASLLLKSAD